MLQGLAVLGGIYLLFLLELLLGMLRRGREATVRAAGAGEGAGLPPAAPSHPTPPLCPQRRSRGDPPDVAMGVLAPSRGGETCPPGTSHGADTPSPSPHPASLPPQETSCDT